MVSSVSLPHCCLTLPVICFQLPSIRSQFIAAPFLIKTVALLRRTYDQQPSCQSGWIKKPLRFSLLVMDREDRQAVSRQCFQGAGAALQFVPSAPSNTPIQRSAETWSEAVLTATMIGTPSSEPHS